MDPPENHILLCWIWQMICRRLVRLFYLWYHTDLSLDNIAEIERRVKEMPQLGQELWLIVHVCGEFMGADSNITL
jgi:hypothetical protein